MNDELLEMQKDTFRWFLIITWPFWALTLGVLILLKSGTFLPWLGIAPLTLALHWLAGRHFRLATWLWVGMFVVLIVAFIPWTSRPAFNPLPYAFILTVTVAGLLISRNATLYVAGLASALSLAAWAATGHLRPFDWTGLSALLPPLLMAWTAAIIGWLGSDQLVTALAWTRNAQLEATRQADSLRQGRDELRKSLEIRDNLNARLQQAHEQVTRRAVQLAAAAEVSQRVTALLELEQLLTEVVELICGKFDYYYAGVFLIDPAGPEAGEQRLLLRAAGGPLGPAMLKRGLQLAVDEHSLNGRAVHTSQTQWVNDITMSPHFRPVDLLHDTISELAIPLRVGRRIVGTLDVQSRQINAFVQDDVAALESLAAQVAIAIQNTRLYESEQTRRRVAETLQEVGRLLSGTLELDRVLDLLLEQLALVVPYKRASVILQSGEMMFMAAARGYGDAQRAGKIDIDIREGDVFSQISRSRQVLVIPDVALFPGWKQVEWLPLDHSWVGAPLIAQDQAIGMLSLTRPERDAFSQDDAELVFTFANQAAIAIHNARLYEETQVARNAAETAARQAQAALRETEGLLAAAKAILGSTQVVDICQSLAHYFNDLVQADRTTLFLVDHERRQIVAHIGYGNLSDEMQVTYEELEAGISGQVFRSGQAVLSLSVDDGTEPEATRERRRRSNAGALVVLPLAIKRADQTQSVIGTITAINRFGQPAFTQHDVELLMSLAAQAAAAIENVRLYEQLQLFNQQLEKLVQERTAELQQAYTRLEHLDRNKSDFIDVAAHELRTPLTVIKGYTDLVRLNPLVAGDAMLKETLEGVSQGMTRLHEVVNRMLDVARIDRQALDMCVEAVQLAGVLQRVQHGFEAALQERQLSLVANEMERLPMVTADPDMLYKVFYNVVINAIKYTPDGGQITLSGRVVNDAQLGECVQVEVHDTGIGIDAQHHKLIFEKLYQVEEVALHSSGKTKFKGGGPGLGLAIAKGIVEAHGGRIWVESPGYDEENCPGSTFYIVLPVAGPKEH
ncbi:MAG: GAF domain-containing protein [Thermoflexales bacterium]|nr:GAF domain-containing protein [Thermoflexales bacterium]